MESVFGLPSAQQSRISTEPLSSTEHSGQSEAEEAPEEQYEATIVRLDHTAAEALFRRAWLTAL
jgi:hypothetical protein